MDRSKQENKSSIRGPPRDKPTLEPVGPGNTRPTSQHPTAAFVVKNEPRQVDIPSVKTEPIEFPVSGTSRSNVAEHEISPLATTSTSSLHSFEADSATRDGQNRLPFVPKERPEPPRPTLTMYKDSSEIVYTPELALEQGLAMVEKAKTSISNLHVTNKMRQEVWNRELQRLQKTGAQKTMIALCGATGAGKSSVINALLNDNIVPTSGMRACTATVTEIAYHNRNTIDADIEFLTNDEWRAELVVLQEDLQDDDGNLKRASDKRTDAGVAWHKVHAVYPALTAEQLVHMTVEEIIASDTRTARILDTTKHLRCADSKQFSKEINKFIDSKNQKRSEKKDKKKSKDKEEQEFWPLIKQVKVWVKAEALSTGAVLCDLPGTADSNAARSSIAKEYMKLANCIWILAPIHRAVDDKTARDLLGEAFKTQLLMDGNYDGSTVTFIATKADDVAPSEVIRALDLEEDPELVPIEEKIQGLKSESKAAKKLKESASAEIKSLGKQIDRHKSIRSELEDHLRCLKTGKKFVARLTAKRRRQHGDNPRKRKSMATGGRGSTKRRRSEDDRSTLDGDSDAGSEKGSFIATSEMESDELEEDSEYESSEDDQEARNKSQRSKTKKKRSRRSTPFSESRASSELSEESESESEADDSDSDEGYRRSKGKSRAKSKKRSRDDSENGDSDVESTDGDDVAETEASLKAKLSAEKTEIERLRSRVGELREQKKEAGSTAAKAKKKLSTFQREKNAFCALKRAEYSRDVLKVDFRTGLRELDELAALERDAESFDPSVALRNYDAIDLPVFCVSARDYTRIHKLNKGDGGPSTFSDDASTEIPSLREWCQHLTVASRERTAKTFLDTLKVFVQSILSYVKGLEGISDAEREALRVKWQTPPTPESEYESDGDDPYAWINGSDGGYTRRPKSPPKDSKGNLIGICARLDSEFDIIVEDTVEDLKEKFKDGLHSKCAEGVKLAVTSAVDISDQFAQEIHWQTYRATLRRDGSFRQDLNELLCMPLTKKIASSWAQVFEANLFASIDKRVLSSVRGIVTRMEKSTKNVGLKEKCQSQGELALEEARVELSKLVAAVAESLQNQQKDISRCIAPTVKEELHDGYLKAALERGRGSVVRQKTIFRGYVKRARNEIFEGCSSNLFSQLDNASVEVQNQLDTALMNLAQKVEVNFSVLWEGAGDTQEQRITRAAAKIDMMRISGQIKLWQDAAKNSTDFQHSSMEMHDD